MQSEKKITRSNAMDIIRRFARDYRKALGKAPGEIIIVGGGSNFFVLYLFKRRRGSATVGIVLSRRVER